MQTKPNKSANLLRNAWRSISRYPIEMRIAKMLYDQGIREEKWHSNFDKLCNMLPEPFMLTVYNYLREIERGTLCYGVTVEEIPAGFDDLTITALCGKIPLRKDG